MVRKIRSCPSEPIPQARHHHLPSLRSNCGFSGSAPGSSPWILFSAPFPVLRWGVGAPVAHVPAHLPLDFLFQVRLSPRSQVFLILSIFLLTEASTQKPPPASLPLLHLIPALWNRGASSSTQTFRPRPPHPHSLRRLLREPGGDRGDELGMRRRQPRFERGSLLPRERSLHRSPQPRGVRGRQKDRNTLEGCEFPGKGGVPTRPPIPTALGRPCPRALPAAPVPTPASRSPTMQSAPREIQGPGAHPPSVGRASADRSTDRRGARASRRAD